MKIELNVNSKKVVCIKKTCRMPQLNTLVILTGATTYDWDYIPLMYSIKNMEVVIINSPGHGVGSHKSEGPALEDASQLIEWYARVIKELMEQGYTTAKINLCGYSMGGMSLLHILNNGLVENVDNSIIMCSDMNTKENAVENAEGFYNKKTKVFNIKSMVRGAITKSSPWYIKHLPINLLSANNEGCFSDIQVGKSMNNLALTKPLKINIKGKVTAIIGKNDYFFNEDMVSNLKNHFTDFKLMKVPYGHMFPLEAPILCASCIVKAILT